MFVGQNWLDGDLVARTSCRGLRLKKPTGGTRVVDVAMPPGSKLQPQPFIELRRESYSDDFMLVDLEGKSFEFSPMDTEFTLRIARKHGIDLDDASFGTMMDSLWQFGIVVYWPETRTWEIL